MTIVNITSANDADFYRTFRYETVSGVAIDITGAAMVMMLRRKADDEAALLRLGTDTGEIALVNAANGLFSIFVGQPRLLKLGLGEFEHSNVMTLASVKRSIWSGLWTNKAGASR